MLGMIGAGFGFERGDGRLLVIAGIYLALFVVYFYLGRGERVDRVGLKRIAGFGLLFNILLIFVWNLTSDDLYTYIYRGRILSKHGDNPYVVNYDTFRYEDMWYEEIRTVWSDKTAIYGPVAILIDGAVTQLGEDNLGLTIYLYKIVYAAVNIACGVLVLLISKSRRAFYLYLWNPVILFELVGNNHNDLFMIFFMLLGFYFLFTKKAIRGSALGVAFFSLSVLSKYTSALVMPVAALYDIRRRRSLRGRAAALGLWMVIFSILVLVCYLPFLSETGVFDRLLSVGSAVTNAPSPALLVMSRGAGRLILAVCIFTVYFLALTRKIDKRRVIVYSALIYGSLFMFGLGLFLPWYLTILIALLAIIESGWIYAVSLLSIGIYLWV